MRNAIRGGKESIFCGCAAKSWATAQGSEAIGESGACESGEWCAVVGGAVAVGEVRGGVWE